MNQINSIILEGNLVKNAEVTEPVSGFKVSKFTIGVNRWYKNRNGEGVTETSFFDVEAYGNVAEYSANYALKGRGVRVVGRLKQDTWKNADGKTASRVYVVAEHIEYRPVVKKNEDSVTAEQTAQTQPEQTEQSGQTEENAVCF